MTNANLELVVVRWQRKSTPTWGWIEVHEDDLDYYKSQGAEIRGLVLLSEASTLISQLTAELDAAIDAEYTTKDYFWQVYEKYLGLTGAAPVDLQDMEPNWKDRAEAAEKRVKELEEGRDLDKVVLDEGIEIINELESSNKLLSERVAVLEASLEPFANTCDEMFNDTCPDDIPAWETEFDTSTVTVGDFRRARTALEGK